MIESLAREPHTLAGRVGRLALRSQLLFDCSCLLEYSKIQTVLQSIFLSIHTFS